MAGPPGLVANYREALEHDVLFLTIRTCCEVKMVTECHPLVHWETRPMSILRLSTCVWIIGILLPVARDARDLEIVT